MGNDPAGIEGIKGLGNKSKPNIIGDFIGQIRGGYEIGLAWNKPHVWVACEICGRGRWVYKYRINQYRKCRECAYREFTFPTGAEHWAWRGGRMKMNGYIRIKLKPQDPYYGMSHWGGLVLEHRLVMAKHLGRCLKVWEFVHHKNGIRDDNKLENLELVTNSQHLKTHTRGYSDGYDAGFKQGYEDARKGIESATRKRESFL